MTVLMHFAHYGNPFHDTHWRKWGSYTDWFCPFVNDWFSCCFLL